MLQGLLLVPQADLLSGRRFGDVYPYCPPAVSIGLLRWSVTGCILHDVQLSCLFDPHALGANFCYRTFPVWVWACSFSFLLS